MIICNKYSTLTNVLNFCGIFRHDQLLREVTIALVGKYTQLEDAYASVIKALQHSALCVSHRLNLKVCIQYTMLEILNCL